MTIEEAVKHLEVLSTLEVESKYREAIELVLAELRQVTSATGFYAAKWMISEREAERLEGQLIAARQSLEAASLRADRELTRANRLQEELDREGELQWVVSRKVADRVDELASEIHERIMRALG